MFNRRYFIIALSLGILSVCLSCSHDVDTPAAPDDDSPVTSTEEIRLSVGEWNPLTKTSRATLFDNESELTDPGAGGGNFTLSTYVTSTGDPYMKSVRVWCRNAPDDWVFLSGDSNVIRYYWPASEALNFFAYMPDNAYIGIDDSYHAKNSYVTMGSYEIADGQTFSCNLPNTITIAETAEIGSSAVPDNDIQEFICAYATGLTRESGTARMHFVHPFSLVEFQMKTAPVDLFINSISIEGISISGTCNVTEATTDGDISGIIWNDPAPGDKTTFTVIINKNVPNHEDTNLNVPIGKPHVVMPQKLKDVTLKINYTYRGTAGEKSASIIPVNNIDNATAVTEWEPGKKYTYAFDFGGNDEDVVVYVSVDEWLTHNEQEIDVY